MSVPHPFRFSLRTLLLAVVAVSVGTAAMVSSSVWWESIATTITAILLTAAILLAVFRSGPSRAFWIGFAVCGGAYFLQANPSPIDNPNANQMLPEMLMRQLANVIHKSPMYGYPTTYPSAPMPYIPATTPVNPTYSVPASTSAMPTLAPVPDQASEPAPEPADESKLKAGCSTTADSSNCGSGEAEEPAQLIPAPDSSPYFDIPVAPTAQAYVPVAQPTTSIYYAPGNPFPYAYTTVYDDSHLRRQRCINIGHDLCTLLFGLVGGCFAVWLHATRDGKRNGVAVPAAADNVKP
jgi:hypothetical protein